MQRFFETDTREGVKIGFVLISGVEGGDLHERHVGELPPLIPRTWWGIVTLLGMVVQGVDVKYKTHLRRKGRVSSLNCRCRDYRWE